MDIASKSGVLLPATSIKKEKYLSGLKAWLEVVVYAGSSAV